MLRATFNTDVVAGGYALMPTVRRKLRQLRLGARGWVLHLFPKPVSAPLHAEQIHRILLIRLDRLGDVILTSALLKPLHQLFPHAQMDIWVQPAFAPLFAGHPYLGQVHTGRPDSAYDLVIDPVLDDPLQGAKRAASFAAPWTMGFDVAGRGRWFNLSVAPPQQDEPFLDSLGRLLRPLGFVGLVASPKLYVSERERREVRMLPGTQEPYLLIHPGAYYPSQRWPSRFMANIADILLLEGYRIIFVGGTGDRTVLDEIHNQLQKIKPPTVVYNQPLRVVMALIAEASVLLCNNSGPLHLASALGTPTVSTMGPTNPAVWWPTGKNQIVLEAPECLHCEMGACPHQCLKRISPELVLKHLRPFIGIPA